PLNEFENVVRSASKDGQTIHYLPLYRSDSVLKTAAWLGVGEKDARNGFSVELIKAIVEQRSIKIAEEIDEMEKAHDTTYQMYEEAMKTTKPGLYERDIAGKMEGIVLAAGCHIAFPTILTINGQILHNHYHGNKLEDGRLLVVDSGAESPMNYASDITRTFPVNGKFTPKQKDIYEIVYNAQMSSIKAIKPGASNKNIHLMAARIIADGLKGMGLMKGNMDDAVDQGAHALFFPHGLGHHIGLDVHDMESYGEDFVGYDETVTRSDQFGLAYLRMAKSLKKGYVITVEPGIYFIPALIDKWKGEGKFLEFIDYDKVNEYRDFGGVRIEDDILVAEDGHRVLGKGIPKTIDDVEALMNS
ncbi:MAG: Xaa-Pro dipeptidase, partial [Candidatus Aminicenantes bacterium]|nr:Xaa-Pro dipeptidase [Candidatus Aminicenantes bacterium]